MRYELQRTGKVILLFIRLTVPEVLFICKWAIKKRMRIYLVEKCTLKS